MDGEVGIGAQLVAMVDNRSQIAGCSGDSQRTKVSGHCGYDII